jgi:SAM-dependent methyltransferase
LQGAGLEVGVGTGKFAGPLGVKTGVDPSRRMVDKARALGLAVAVGTAEELPVRTGCLDLVLMVTTICFVDDIARAFQEAFRVLRSKGIVVVGFVDKDSELGRQYMRRKDHSKFYRWANFFSARQVLQYLADAGFEKIESKQTLFPTGQPRCIQNGFGSGSFIVVKGSRPSPRTRRGTS